MASHVPILAVRPEDQFGADAKPRDIPLTNGSLTASTSAFGPLPTTMAETSRIPSALRLPLLCTISLSLNLLVRSALADVTGVELSLASRKNVSFLQIGILAAWKIAELVIGWDRGYDFFDLSNLSFLTNVPYYFLLKTFYGIETIPLLLSLAIDVASFAVPFALLRHLSSINRGTRETPNKEVAWDFTTRAATALLGAAIYAAAIFGSFQTWLPVYMINHFDDVVTFVSAHDAALWDLLAIFSPIGLALTHFIFVPAISSIGNPGITDPAIKPASAPFNPETATLGETLAWNVGLSKAGHTRRAELIAERTGILAVATLVNTFLRVFLVVKGSELIGSFGWASVWAVAAGLAGVALSWVGNE